MKKKIAIVAGGDSSEAEISYKSAEQLALMLDNNLYDIYIIAIHAKEWKGISNNCKEVVINKADFSLSIDNVKIAFDCVFIAIHGTPGENGILQAYFELLEIPYTSSGVFSSALTFNKYATKLLLNNYNIPYARTILHRKGEKTDTSLLVKELGLPLFIKPNRAGSSFGVSKVKNEMDIHKALEKAYTEDDEVLIEQYIQGTELTCGIIKTVDKEIVFPVTEIVSKTEFFDYRAKYEGMSEEITPARIPDAISKECQAMTSHIYDITKCHGVVRMDYFLCGGKLYFNEINSVPGMSSSSIVPQQIRAMGLNPGDIFSMAIEDAIIRATKKRKRK